MAQFFDNFANETIGTQPSKWTSQWSTNGTLTVEADATAQGGKIARVENSVFQQQWIGFVFEEPGVLGNNDLPIRVRARFSFGYLDPSSYLPFLALHVSGAFGGENGYNLQLRERPSGSGNNFALSRYSSGSGTSLGIIRTLTLTNSYYQILLERHSGGVRVKFWVDSQSEPSSWGIESSDTSITSGMVAILGFLRSTSTAFDWVGVGTNGDPAPDEPLQPDPPTGLSLQATGPTSIAVSWNEPD